MMDFREYRMVEEPPLQLDSVEVLDLCVRRGGGNEEHRIPIKEERSSPTMNTEQIIHYSTTSNNVPKYADTAHSFHVPPQIQPVRPDAISFGTGIRSSGSAGVIRPHPTMATPNVQYFPLQQEQKQQQTKSLVHQHLLQPNSPPPSMTSECHIALSSPSPASHSPSSSDCSSIPATSPTVPVVTQTPNPLSLGYMLQTPTTFPILPPAIPPLQSPVLNSSSKGSNNGKPQRPFKAINISMSHNLLRSQDYLHFRQRMLEKIERRIGKINNKNNQPKRAASPSQQPSSSDVNIQNIGSDGGVSRTSTVKDAAYRERRKKNNEAAKRSRDARREKEDELAIRTSFLEQENMILKCQVISLEKKLGIYPSANTLRWQL